MPGTAGVTASSPALRVTEYYLDSAGTDLCAEAGTDFEGTVCTLALNQNLATDYFVIVQGSESGGADRTPAADYAALTGDAFGTGDLAAVGASQIQLTRGADVNNWQGVVTVVECIAPNCATDPSGFQLLTVENLTLPATGAPTGTGGTDTSWGGSWGATPPASLMLLGGANGAGCLTTNATLLEHHTCHVRLSPPGRTPSAGAEARRALPTTRPPRSL